MKNWWDYKFGKFGELCYFCQTLVAKNQSNFLYLQFWMSLPHFLAKIDFFADFPNLGPAKISLFTVLESYAPNSLPCNLILLRQVFSLQLLLTIAHKSYLISSYLNSSSDIQKKLESSRQPATSQLICEAR